MAASLAQKIDGLASSLGESSSSLDLVKAVELFWAPSSFTSQDGRVVSGRISGTAESVSGAFLFRGRVEAQEAGDRLSVEAGVDVDVAWVALLLVFIWKLVVGNLENRFCGILLNEVSACEKASRRQRINCKGGERS